MAISPISSSTAADTFRTQQQTGVKQKPMDTPTNAADNTKTNTNAIPPTASVPTGPTGGNINTTA